VVGKLSGLNDEQPTKQAALHPLDRQHAAVRLSLAPALAHKTAGRWLHHTTINSISNYINTMSWLVKFRSKNNKAKVLLLERLLFHTL
jgi:hypothetical protein